MIKLFGYHQMAVLVEREGTVMLMGKLPTGEWIDGPTLPGRDAVSTLNPRKNHVRATIIKLGFNEYEGKDFASMEDLETFLFAKYPEELEAMFPGKGISEFMTPDVVRRLFGDENRV